MPGTTFSDNLKCDYQKRIYKRMKPGGHIIVSVSLGAGLWFFTRSFYAGLLCFASGILLDIDHFIEYAIHYGWKDLSIKKIYHACEETGKEEGEYGFPKLYLILHIAEIALLLWIVLVYTKNVYLLAIALGYTSHLILDWARNQFYPFALFMTVRIISDFDTGRLLRKK